MNQSRRRIRPHAAAIAVVALLLAGCGTTRPASPAAAGSSTSTTTTTSQGSPATSTAVDAARTAFEAWSDRDQAYGAWWSRLKPLLSDAGQLAYAGTDPQAIPVLHVTGAYQQGRTPDDPDTTALVKVPTDRGTFGLLLSRSAPGAPWRLLQINFPAGIH